MVKNWSSDRLQDAGVASWGGVCIINERMGTWDLKSKGGAGEDEGCVRKHGWRPAVAEFDGKDIQ